MTHRNLAKGIRPSTTELLVSAALVKNLFKWNPTVDMVAA